MAKNDDGGTTFLGCLALVLMFPFSVAWKAFVAVNLWGWFVVPLGAPRVGMAHAVGLMVVVTMATLKLSKSDLEAESAVDMVGRAITANFLVPAMLLAIGRLAQLMMTAGY